MQLDEMAYQIKLERRAAAHAHEFAIFRDPLAHARNWAGPVIDGRRAETPAEYVVRVRVLMAQDTDDADAAAQSDGNPGWGNLTALRAALREGR